MILLLLVLLRTLHLHVGLELDGTGRELDVASSCERFSEVGPGVFHVSALLVELGELVEIYLVGEVVGSLAVSCQARRRVSYSRFRFTMPIESIHLFIPMAFFQ